MSIGFKIRKLREEKDYSQPYLANLLNISQSELSKIENEQTKKIDFLLMDKVCKEFDVDFRYFTESNQINNIEKLEGSVNNHGIINMTPKNVLNFIENVLKENIKLKKENDLLNKKNTVKIIIPTLLDFYERFLYQKDFFCLLIFSELRI